MTTYNEVAYNVSSFLNKNGHNNNSTITIPQIVYWIDYYYAFFIRDYINKGDDTLAFEQAMTVPLEIYNSTPSCLNYKFLYKSKIEIPETARLKGKATGIISVVENCSNEKIPLKSYSTISELVKGKYFDKTKPFAYLKNDNYLYVENDTFLQKYFNNNNTCSCKDTDVICDKCKNSAILPLKEVTVNGIFIKPLVNDKCADKYDVEFNCPLDVVKRITDAILQTPVQLLLKIPNSPEDLHNLKDGDVKYREN